MHVPVSRTDWELASQVAGARRPRRRRALSSLIINVALLGVTTFSLVPLAVVGRGAEAEVVGPEQELERELWEVLLGRGDMHDATPEEAMAKLVSLGRDRADFFIDVLLGDGRPPEGKGPPPPWSRQEMATSVLAALPSELVLAELELTLESNESMRARLLGLQLLGLVGSSDSMSQWVDWARELETLQLASPHVRTSVVESLEQLVRRNAASLEVLRPRLANLEPELLACIASGVRRSRVPRSIDLMESLLSRTPELDAVVIDELAAIDIRDAVQTPNAAIDLIWPFLLSPDPVLRRHAVTGLARLRAEPMYDDIIGMLEDDDERVVLGAHWALRYVSSLEFPGDSILWGEWFDEQESWFRETAPRLAEDVRSDSIPQALRALRDLSRHTIYRRNLAKWAASGLQHEADSVAIATCSTLAVLGSPAALPPLIDALRSPEPAVREAARRTLVELTGEDLGADYGAWADWLHE